ncbi:MAG: response regulator [Oligoflexus sp.]|nr:response regulator [Oligoflexus sp.]
MNRKIPSRTILVLEQDKAYSKTISREAKSLKLDVVMCSDIGDFTQKARRAHFDFALVNFEAELFQASDVAKCFENRPMVVMSADALVHNKQEYWPESVAGFISKNVGAKEVLEAALGLVPAVEPVNQTVHYLLIDDDIVFGQIVIQTAKPLNIVITHVSSFDELRKNKALNGYDAVILDYDLEETTGFAVAEILNTTAHDKPIIMVSATNRPDQDRLNGLPNIIGFVSKWLPAQEFLSRTVELQKIQSNIKNIVNVRIA